MHIVFVFIDEWAIWFEKPGKDLYLKRLVLTAFKILPASICNDSNVSNVSKVEIYVLSSLATELSKQLSIFQKINVLNTFGRFVFVNQK